ncbi:sodium/proline symporter PutP [Mobiluncus porci]|uniref:Sodium/proline symporter n=1 Tax=Mobiluncus porci TaxID=2652278 RepID=A0A7K0K5W5_9ACTO|nr:sodium/proline symporter PutP [Mobiluncus porci]MST50415.1 sodium/proline symporter PutP [Mobiluncus porci]
MNLFTIVPTTAEVLSGTQGVAIAMIVYFTAMIIIGIWAYTRTSTMDDYMLGGRELNPLVAALSAGAADMSGWLLMGLPGALYAAGLVQSWIAIGLTVGAYINWWIVAPRLRTYTEVSQNSITVPSFLSNRLRDRSNALRVTAGIIFFIFFTLYVASGLVSGGKFFDSSFGIPYETGMIIVASIVVLYTLVGGFLAVSWTDMVQGLMMVIALVTVPIVGLIMAGGFEQVALDVAAKGAATDQEMLSLVFNVDPRDIITGLAWGLGYFGMPHIIVRFMALKTPQQTTQARRIWAIWMALSLFGAIGTAMVGISLAAQGIINMDGADDETIFLVTGQTLFPSLIAGFMLAAILAAIMSTVSSQLLVTSSAVVEDIYNSFSKHNVKEVNLGITIGDKTVRESNLGVTMGRVVVLIVTVIAVVLAWNAKESTSFISSSILAIVSFAWAGFGAAFGPIIILSLWWRKLTAQGALWGMITGAVVVVLWHYLLNNGKFSTIVDTKIYEILPGFVLCWLVAYVVSILTYQPNPEIDAEFDKAIEMAKAKEYVPFTQENHN